MTPEVLEPQCEWSAEDVQDSEQWTEQLSASEIKEIDEAIAYARTRSDNFLEISKHEFPLPTLAARLRRIENDLINGRGFVLIRGLPRERFGLSLRRVGSGRLDVSAQPCFRWALRGVQLGQLA